MEWKKGKRFKPLMLRVPVRRVKRLCFRNSVKQCLINLLRTHDLSCPLPETAHDQFWDLLKCYLIADGLPEEVNTYREKWEIDGKNTDYPLTNKIAI